MVPLLVVIVTFGVFYSLAVAMGQAINITHVPLGVVVADRASVSIHREVARRAPAGALLADADTLERAHLGAEVPGP